MAGDEVKSLQTALNLWGESIAVDGVYGPGTEQGVQRFQASVGIPVDGIYGPITAKTLVDKVRFLQPVPAPAVPAPVVPSPTPVADVVPVVEEMTDAEVVEANERLTVFDDRSEKNLATLLPAVQAKARAFMTACASAGVPVKIISGARTYPEQDALYAQGRTAPGDIVTYARAGFSNHNFSCAFDIGIFSPGYLEESPLYDKAGALGKSVGLVWGGDWKGKKCDKPHFEYPTDYSLKDMRDMVAAKKWPPSELIA